MHAIALLNPAAGGLVGQFAGETPAAVHEQLARVGITSDVELVPAAAMSARVQQACSARPDLLLIGGGDGTLSTAAACLAGKDVLLGVLPLGTLNHFARDLGLPASWPDAVTAMAHGVPRRVDVGEVNGRVFINNCSIGSYAEAVRKREVLRRTRGSRKSWAMVRATLDVFWQLRRLRVQIAVENTIPAVRPVRLRTPFVVVANNRYSGHVLGSSLRPRLDEGRLWIYTTRAGRRLAMLRLFVQSLFRNLDEVDHLEKFTAGSAKLSTPRHPPVALDGELVELEPPFTFRSRPGALLVLAPRLPANS